MGVLKSPKRERFAQELAKGKTQVEAYALAGYRPHDSNAAALANAPEIAGRVAEIIGRAAERAEVTKAMVMAELAKIGFSNMLDYVTIDSEGLCFVDMTSLTREQAAAIQEVVVETKTEIGADEDGTRKAIPVRKVKFRLLDKRAALVDLGKELGMFKERVEHSGTVTLADLVMASLPGEEKASKPTAH